MATGDQADLLIRLRALLPAWFPQQGQAPVIDGVLTGIASGLSFVYALIQFARAQMRVTTASGGWIDFWAWDYLGGRVVRKLQELDATWIARIKREVLRPRNTRASVTQALVDLTGIPPAIFEPSLPQDTGGYGSLTTAGGPLAYNLGGGYGSLSTPWTALIGAFRPATTGIPYMAGYNAPSGAYASAGSLTGSLLAYNTLSQIVGQVTDADILAAIDAVRPIGTVLTTGISNLAAAIPMTDESGNALTDEFGIPLYLG
jgi:hypothetical protein